MFKYKLNAEGHTHTDGKYYRTQQGVLTVPFKIDAPFAIFIEEVKDDSKPDWKQLALDSGLEGDELKKFMKMNATNKQIKLDRLGA